MLRVVRTVEDGKAVSRAKKSRGELTNFSIRARGLLDHRKKLG